MMEIGLAKQHSRRLCGIAAGQPPLAIHLVLQAAAKVRVRATRSTYLDWWSIET
jgi:hypothetical protein